MQSQPSAVHLKRYVIGYSEMFGAYVELGNYHMITGGEINIIGCDVLRAIVFTIGPEHPTAITGSSFRQK